jgi:hypothetical protein
MTTNPGDTYTASACSSPHGSTSPVVTGNQICLTYRPAVHYNGPDTACVVICNNQTHTCDTVRIPVTVSICIPPVISNVTKIDPTTAACPIQNNGNITITATGTRLRYSVDSGATWQVNNVFSTLIPGTYHVWAQDSVTACHDIWTTVLVLTGGSCTPEIPITPMTVPQDSVMTVCTDILDNRFDTHVVTSCGAEFGTVTVAVSASTTPGVEKVCVTYTPYTRFYGADTLCLTVCDQGGLCSQVTFPVTVNRCVPPTITSVLAANVTYNSCPQLNNGGITINAIGNNLIYSIDNGAHWQNSNIFTDLRAGTYNAIVKNYITTCFTNYTSPIVITAPNCYVAPVISAMPKTIGQDSTLSFCAPVIDNPLDRHIAIVCGTQHGISMASIPSQDGQVCISYTPNTHFIGQDTICVIVCDQTNLCDTARIPVTVNACVLPVISSVVATPPTSASCPSLNNGSVSINATGSNLWYSIDNGLHWQVSNTFSNLTQGSYNVKVQNFVTNCISNFNNNPVVITSPGCNTAPTIAISPRTITQDSVLSLCLPIIDNLGDTHTATACGAANGTINTVNANSSQVCLTYTPSLHFVGQDTICITVCDQGNLCTTIRIPVSVTSCLAPTITGVTKMDPTCPNRTDGSITINAAGTGLTYSIDNGAHYQSSNSFSGLVPNSYVIKVKNASGCITTALQPCILSLIDCHTPQFDVKMTMKSMDCYNRKAVVQVWVRTHPGTDTFLMANANYRFDYDTRKLRTPSIVSQEHFSSISPSLDNNYAAQNLNGSSEGPTVGTVSLNTIYGQTGYGRKVDSNWTAVSCIQFEVLDTTSAACYNLIWHRDTNFPATGMTGETMLDPALGTYDEYVIGASGEFDNLNFCWISSCNCTTVSVKAILEGPYNAVSNKMNTVLNQRGLLPGQTPVGGFAQPTPSGQPYNIAPWNYMGTETLSTYPADIVDWVLVSIRTDSTTSGSALVRKAGLLHDDGRITFIDPCWIINSGQRIWAVVEHRNHLGVMSPVGITNQSGGSLNFDFTTSNSFVKNNPPTTGEKFKSGKWMMATGDGKKNVYTANFDINFSDSQLWKLQSGVFDSYRSGDFNLDADVNFSDEVIWKKNNGLYSGVPH